MATASTVAGTPALVIGGLTLTVDVALADALGFDALALLIDAFSGVITAVLYARARLSGSLATSSAIVATTTTQPAISASVNANVAVNAPLAARPTITAPVAAQPAVTATLLLSSDS